MKFLTTEQKEFYQTNGYIILDLLSKNEIEDLSKEYNKIFESKLHKNLEATWKGDWNKPDNIKLEVKSIHGLQMYSSFFTQLLLQKSLLDACEDIMQTSNILLHHTKAHLKPPGTGSPFPMHQDYHYFPFEKDSMIAIFISVDESDRENGGLCVYPGSHKLGPQKDYGTNGYHYLSQLEFPIEKATPLSLKKGQIVIFSYLLIHGSYFNSSADRVRRMFLIQLMSAEDTALNDVHNSVCQKMVLRGFNASRVADISNRHN